MWKKIISKIITLVINPLSANPIKWSNTLKKFVGNCRRNVWVCWAIFWGWCLKDWNSTITNKIQLEFDFVRFLILISFLKITRPPVYLQMVIFELKKCSVTLTLFSPKNGQFHRKRLVFFMETWNALTLFVSSCLIFRIFSTLFFNKVASGNKTKLYYTTLWTLLAVFELKPPTATRSCRLNSWIKATV